MKNWVLKFSIGFLLVTFIASCNNRNENGIDLPNKNNIIIASEESLEAIHFYSNDAFSKMVKDLIFDPLFYYDELNKKIQSRFIHQVQWIHESEVVLHLNNGIFFHDNAAFKLEKGRSVTSKDLAHSISIVAKNTPYPSVQSFLANIDKLNSSETDQLVISLRKNVNAVAFIEELSAIEIPIVPEEIIDFSQLKNFVGTNCYSFEQIHENYLTFSVFKNHELYKRQNNLSPLIILATEIPYAKQLQLFETKQIDGIFTKNQQLLTANIDKISQSKPKLFPRKQDRLTVALLNFEKSFSANYQNIDFILHCFDPEKYVIKQKNNQWTSFYSNWDLNPKPIPNFQQLSIDFKLEDRDYENYIRDNFKKNGIQLIDTNSSVDIIIYTLKTPSNWIKSLEQDLLFYFVDFGNNYNKALAKESSVLLTQEMYYFIFSEKIQFLNEQFDTRNDFSTIFKRDN